MANPEDAHALYLLARAYLKADLIDESAESARRAIEIGNARTRETFSADPLFQPRLEQSPFREIFHNPAEY